MKLTTLFAVLATFSVTTASPIPTRLATNSGWTLFKRGARLVWDPTDAYETQKSKKRKWERVCLEALARADCDRGTIHQGEIKSIRDGRKISHINIEGASSTDTRPAKKMRVFKDGVSEYVDKWSERDFKLMREAKRRPKKNLEPHEVMEPQEGPKTVLSWDPRDTYKTQGQRRTYWEQKCRPALTRAGCTVGTIHQGEVKLIRNGQKTSYMNVEGAPSKDLMKKPTRMRVFLDGSSEIYQDGWPERDRMLMATAKRQFEARHNPKPDPTLNMKPDLARPERVLLFWEPANAYKKRPNRKAYWESRCDVALAKAGCDGGTIFKGERKLTKPNGEEASYINVEAAPSVGMDHGKKLRVFDDGSFETVDDWTARDAKLMRDSRIPRRPDSHTRRKTHKGLVEGVNTSSQAPTEESSQKQPALGISWDPPNAYRTHKRFRSSFEEACRSALKDTGCDYGIIHQGYHEQEKTDTDITNPDIKKPRYLLVAAGEKHDPGSQKYFRLFENGSSVWFSPGRIPKKDLEVIVARLQAPSKRKRGRPKKQDITNSTQAQGVGSSALAPTQKTNQVNDIVENTRDNPKRQRLGGDDHQYSEPRAHAQAPIRPDFSVPFHARGEDVEGPEVASMSGP